jgi:glutamate dehydrogenase/leucine dehydrogenase
LEAKRVFIIPEILGNAGDVTVSCFDWVQDEQHLFWEARDVHKPMERVMKASFNDVLKIHTEQAGSAVCRQHSVWQPSRGGH